MELTDGETEVLKRVLTMIMKKPRDKLPPDIAPEELQAIQEKLEHRPTIREAREIRRKAAENAEAEAKKD